MTCPSRRRSTAGTALRPVGRAPAVGLAVALGTLCAAGCTIDTELGVDATVQSASVAVSGTDASIMVDLSMRFRVGEHAQGARMFIVPRADLVVDGRPVTTVNLDRPSAFDGTLSPGEEQTVRITGTALGALEMERAALCAAPVEVQLLVRWEDTTAMEIGMVDFTTRDVTCD